MTAYVVEWLSLLGRWVHVITGIAWIGASFYFVWLDNHLLAPGDEDLRSKGVGGELWAVHGGGFYHAQKYRVAPHALPSTLHWFYWEAYSTFLSGFFLLCLLYYAQADIYLIDPQVMPLRPNVAIVIGLTFVVGGWVIYDALCRSPLARRGAWLGCIIAGVLCIAAWSLCKLFSGRGAFIEFGAMLGGIMVANVFFVIIPGQREMVDAKRESREPDSQAGVRGKLRSVHNTYFTLPVLFTMISNHYASMFNARYNWLVLIAMSAAGALLRAFFVMRHKRHERGGRTAPWPAYAGLLILAGTAWALAPTRQLALPVTPNFATVRRIIAERCAPCHAVAPSQAGFPSAPKGVLLDSADAIILRRAQIAPQIASRAMPLGNLTGMTEMERSIVLDWSKRDTAH